MTAKQAPKQAAGNAAKKPPGKAKADEPAGGLEVGAKAPSFTLPRDGGESVSLKDFAGRKLVLYFYPRANTPGCTIEAIDFSRLKPAFARAGADVLGVSGDPVKAQDVFKAKHKLTIALGSDETHEMLEAYTTLGFLAAHTALRPQILGRGARNLPDRARPAYRADMAEGYGRGPCRGSACCGQSALKSAWRFA